jgi:hypothetical protein
VDQRTSIAYRGLNHCLAGGNPLSPDLMTADQRLTEMGTILAAGLLRLRRQQSDKHVSHLEKKGLDFSPARSVHATTGKRRKVAR